MAGNSSSTKQLQRRLRGLSPKQWDVQVDRDLLEHLASARSLASLDELSDFIYRATEHIAAFREDTNRQKNFVRNHLLPMFRLLCTALGPALQQLADGLQQYSSSGQLPAAVTDQAVDALNCMCQLTCVFCWIGKPDVGAQREALQPYLAQYARNAGGCTHHW
jgi:hypothetical protein